MQECNSRAPSHLSIIVQRLLLSPDVWLAATSVASYNNDAVGAPSLKSVAMVDLKSAREKTAFKGKHFITSQRRSASEISP